MALAEHEPPQDALHTPETKGVSVFRRRCERLVEDVSQALTEEMKLEAVVVTVALAEEEQ